MNHPFQHIDCFNDGILQFLKCYTLYNNLTYIYSYKMIQKTQEQSKSSQNQVQISCFQQLAQNAMPRIREQIIYKFQQSIKRILKKILPQIQSQQIIYQNQISLDKMNQIESQSHSLINQFDSQNEQNHLTKKYLNRSSNNSYKKYTSAAKKNLFKLISSSKKNKFIEEYKQYKSIYALTRLSIKQIKKFIKGFVKDVKKKIFQYQDQAINTKNKALQKFRLQEIQDIKLSLISLKLFVTRSIEEGIQVVYKKNRGQISKLAEYKKSVATIKKLAEKTSFNINSLNLGEVIDSEINRKIKERILILGQIPTIVHVDDLLQQKQNQQEIIMQEQPKENLEQQKNMPNIQKLKQIQNKRTRQEQSQEQDMPINSFNLIQTHSMPSFPFMAAPTFMNFSFGINPIGFNMFSNQPFKFDQFKEEQNQNEKRNNDHQK